MSRHTDSGRKVWLERTRKQKAADYISTKNIVGKKLAWYDVEFDNPNHLTQCIDGFMMSRKHRWYYNFDVETTGGLIIRQAFHHAYDTIDRDDFITKGENLYAVDFDEQGWVRHQMRPEFVQPYNDYHKAIQQCKLQFVKDNDFNTIHNMECDFNYSYGIGLHIVLPVYAIDSQDQMDGFIEEFLKEEYFHSTVVGKFDKSIIVDRFEQELQQTT